MGHLKYSFQKRVITEKYRNLWLETVDLNVLVLHHIAVFFKLGRTGLLSSFAESEPRAEEPNLFCLPEPEPKLRIAVPAPAPFYLSKT
jgi:hypothetical protein